MKEKQNIIEALIFASDIPLPAAKIKEILEDGNVKQIKKQIELLNQKYDRANSPLQIIEVAGGFQIVTRKEYEKWITKLYKSRSAGRLTRRALETVAIIAYKQPITKTEVEAIRGVNVDSVVRTLIERNLITVTGREKAPGNPLLYGTTKYFLEFFGLKDISDLPKLKEIDELLKSDEKFLESLDQVSLEYLNPEKLGLSSMLKNDNNSTEDIAAPDKEEKNDAAE